jgi:hypothetical protein
MSVTTQQTAEQSTSTTNGATPDLILTAAHRCDAGNCGAQARAHIIFPTGLDLTFCRHHTEAKRASLIAAGATVSTQYADLGAALDVSA